MTVSATKLDKGSIFRSVGKFPLLGFAIALIIGVSLSIFVVQSTLNEQYRNKLVGDAADGLQQRLNLQLQGLLSQTNRLATSTRLSQLVDDADATAISLEEARVRETIPNALRVRLIRLGEARVDRDSQPPFIFTSVDLVNRIEAGESVFPEAINANGRWVLSIAAPIKRPSESKVHGTLFLYLDMNAISDSFATHLPGGLKLMQSFGNSPGTDIMSVGAVTEDSKHVRALNNPNWHLAFYPNNALSTAVPAGMMLYLLPALAALLIALIMTLVGIGRFATSLAADLTHLDNQLLNVTTGQYQPSTGYSLAAFIDLDDHLQQLSKAPPPRNKSLPGINEAVASKLGLSAVSIDPVLPAPVSAEINRLDTDALVATASPPEPEAVIDTDLSLIFRAYDIRGVVGETLTPAVIYKIGMAIGSEAADTGQSSLLVGADGRLSSPEVMEALIDGILATGTNVISLGAVPTPVLYFGTHTTETRSGVMITGSHNPPEYNGFKIVLDGRTLVETDIARLYKRFLTEQFSSGAGQLTEEDIRAQYIEAISDDVVVAQPLRVVIDCGNGIAGEIAPNVLKNLGCEVIPLYCDVDGNFPNHHPDPTIAANLADLILMVKSQEADLGIALDGDGDRLVAVTSSGVIIAPDQLLMLFAKDIVSRNPGSDVVYDVKCTRHLSSIISGFGGRPIICRSGHSYLKEKMAETDAVLGGEFSGHICFQERWFGFDDGLYAGARLLEIVGSQTAGLDELIGEFPQTVSTPEIQIPVSDADKFGLVNALIDSNKFDDGSVSLIDGIRVDYSDGWGLVRASNTSPCLTLRFEADDDTSLRRIQNMFRENLLYIDKRLTF
ncbi:MAG: phosphomannomutase/phosphoglucomutase [Candidatus Azotimanducaceae bacterium]